MSFDAHRLLHLLPAVYGLRDHAQAVVTPGWLVPEERQELATLQGLIVDGFVLTPDQQRAFERLQERALAGPLASLLAVLAEQFEVLEEDLEQLYDDLFIDTCAEWVVPYIGDLIGYRGLHNISDQVGRPRAEVAHTIGFRRRKGTLAVLEQLAADVTGWPASAVEFFQRLITTQYMNHVRLHIAAAPDLRRWEPLERINTAFDVIPRSVDVRRIEPRRGRHNIPNIGLFVWRLNAYSMTRSPVARVDTLRHRFNPLGIDQPLFTNPETEQSITQLAGPTNVPIPISRRVLAERLADYYSDDDHERSLRIYWDRDDGAGIEAVPLGQIRVCHLGDDNATWAHLPEAGLVAIDPVLGRLALPPEATDDWRVWVDFYYGFPADLGGGEYERAASFEHAVATQVLRVPDDFPTVQEALDNLGGDGVVEITDSGRYVEPNLSISVSAGARIELRAANNRRPILILGDEGLLRGGDDSEAAINGLLIAGHRLRVPEPGNQLARLSLTHCTLVPGWTLAADLAPQSPDEPSLIIDLTDFALTLTRSITGPLRVPEGATVHATDCIIDATRPEGLAVAADDESAGAALTLEACTLVGRIRAHTLPLVSNCILLARRAAVDEAPIRSDLRQQGCVRFTWLPPASRTPRRYRCLPESAASPKDALLRFVSLRYGGPAYLQLSGASGARLLTGAEDEAEPGVYHHLYGTWRDTNLRVRLDEYLRVGLQAGTFHEN